MRPRFWVWFLALVTLASCLDENDYKIDSVEVSPTVALPLVFGELSVGDLIKSQDSVYVKVYPDDLVYLAYSQTLASQGIADLFDIPNKSLNRSFFVPPATIPPHTKDIRSDSLVEVVDLGIAPELLSEISFKTGTIDYSTTTNSANLLNKYEINVSLRDFTSKTTGKPLNINFASTGSINLSDYIVHLDKNKFNLKLVLVLKKTTSTTVISPNSFVNIKLSFLGMDFSYIKGFFGDQTASLPADTIDIGAFGTALDDANVSFAQPKIELEVTNENGVPCQVDFKKFQAQNDTQVLDVILNPANPISIAYPTQPGSSAKTLVSVVNEKELLDFAPTRFYYKVDARINKGFTSGNNFLADTSKIKVKMNVEIPLYGHASNINLLDTIKVGLGDMDESTVNSAFLKVKITNELPLDAKIQIYMTDDKYKILDSLLAPTQTAIIKGSTVTTSGDLLSPGVYDQLIPLDKSKIDKVFNSSYIIIRAAMNTSKDATGAFPDVKFKSRYKMKVDIGLLANLKISAEL